MFQLKMPPNFLRPGYKCSVCLSVFKWLPVVFITAIVAWSYYAYVIQLCFLTVSNIFEKVAYIILYHGTFGMFAWSYWQTIFAKTGAVPKQFGLPALDVEKIEKETSEDAQRHLLDRFAKDLPIACRTLSGAVRYCEKCHHVKPDRAHHCSVCGTCVLKMDHHCPWVNNCVCFGNYKFFILFLGYSLIYCIFISATTLQYFIMFWTNDLEGWGRFHILFLFFVAVMFAISLVSLFGYHCYLVSVNRSTLESFRPPIFRTGPDKDGFGLGCHANFLEIFGEDRKLWFLPFFTSLGDGVTYPTRNQAANNSYDSMGNTQATSLGDGVSFPQRAVDEDTDGLLNRQRWEELGMEEEGHLADQSLSDCKYSPTTTTHHSSHHV